MFCGKCGAEALDDAIFCEKCGAKLMVAGDVESTTPERSAQADMREPVEPMASEMRNTYMPASARETYDLLSENASHCSSIKKVVFREKQGMTILKGKIYRYFVRFSQSNFKLTAIPVSPFDIPMIILVFAIAYTESTFVWNLADGYGTNFNEIYLILGLGLFFGGLLGAIISAIPGNREKKEVASFIGKVLSTESCIKGPVFFTIVYSVAALAGIVVLTVGSGALDNMGVFGRDEYVRDQSSYGTYNDRPEEDQYKPEEDQYKPSSDAENVSLSKVYTNEEEGFSFMYPDDWIFEDVEEGDLEDAFVSVASTGIYGIYARIAVMKVADDGSLYAATGSDFEVEYSSVGLSDVKVMDLSDIVLDGCPARKLTFATIIDGVQVVEIQYFYIRDSYIYMVTCAVKEDDYERYEPIFDAIMDSYTITISDKSGENADKVYTNEEEGFSFIYPYNWDIVDDVDDEDVLVSVTFTGLSEAAGIFVTKTDDYDGSLFDGLKAASKADFETEYVPESKVMDLSDMVLDGCPARKLTYAYSGDDDEFRDVCIQYFYSRESYIYIVTCLVAEDDYERYEPIFDAIMDSYTITVSDKFMEDTDMEDMYEDIWGWEEPDDSYPFLGYGLEWVEEPYVTTNSLGRSVINGVIENTSGSNKNWVIITFDLYDVNGYQIDQASDSIQNLRSGGKWKFSATVWSDDAVYWEFADVTVY